MRTQRIVAAGLAVGLLAGTQTAFAAPANDAFGGATLIAALPFGDAADTTGATREPGEPSCYGISNTVWYRFTAPTSGVIVADTRGSDFDTVLAVYSGNGPFDLRQIRCDDNGIGTQSIVRLSAQGGTTYFFQAGGRYGAAGNLRFNLAFPGTLSGTVLDEVEEGPQSDICVDVYERDAKVLVASAYTDLDGEYRVTGLPPAEYKVRFKDCADRGPAFFGAKGGLFLTEWWEAKKSFRSSDPVTVVGGMERSNVDAFLRIRPRPDLGIVSVAIENIPLTVGPAPDELPSPAYNRRVTVTATNTGPVTPRWSKIGVDVCPRTVGSCKHLGDKTVLLKPGVERTRRFDWNGADMAGDVTVVVLVNANEDSDWNDNVEEIPYFVHIGGTGFGAGPRCALTPPQTGVPCHF